jgi:hypothetical protein
MPQQAWSNKRERQYEHIKESEREQGRSPKRAKEIAARTVNKQRAEAGETKSSRSSRSSSGSNGGKTRAQLYEQAKKLGVEGRSKMNKEQLQRAVAAKR